jgi:spore coat protein A
MDQITIGPGERADVIIDFAGRSGQMVILKNRARAPYPKGEPPDSRTVGQIMAFNVGTTVTTPDNPIPPTLRSTPIVPLQPTAPARRLLLFEAKDTYERLRPSLGTTVDGAMMWDDPITETPTLNDVEVWEVFNTTEDAHPIHLHLVAFQILNRQRFKAEQNEITGALSNIRLVGQPKPPEANEKGWKDTAPMYPGEVTRVIAKFDRLGEYVWHCHILSHEDHEMMRPYTVVPASTPKLVLQTSGLAETFSLEQNYPNPFNPSTEIRFQIEEQTHVRLSIYNVLGEELQVLLDEAVPAGQHTVKLDASSLTSGIYWYRLTAAGSTTTRKMILLR